MKKIVNTLVFVSTLLVFSGRVFALPYSFSVDRFEVTGNLVGIAYDDFDNSSVSPQWGIDSGTVVESGGVATFTNPGSLNSYTMGGYFITNESSQIASSHGDPTFHVEDGFGDFVGTSTWLPYLPTENQWSGMQADINYSDGRQLEFIKMFLFRADSDMSALLGIPTGLGISFGRFLDSPGGEYYSIPIDESDIAGEILFQLSFNDATNMFDGAFSLDGGTTFQNPFPSVLSSMGGQGVFSDWELEGGAFNFQKQAVPEPVTVMLFSSGFIGLAGLRRKLKMSLSGC